MIDLFISVRLTPYPLEPRGEAFNYSNYRIRGMIKNTLHVPKLIVSDIVYVYFVVNIVSRTYEIVYMYLLLGELSKQRKKVVHEKQAVRICCGLGERDEVTKPAPSLQVRAALHTPLSTPQPLPM